MSIAPADLFLMRLNVLVNIGMKAADTLWWTSVSLFIIGLAMFAYFAGVYALAQRH